MAERVPISEMTSPVRCVCGGVYDLGTVEVTSRHMDCSVWRAPCCGLAVDDNIFSRRHNFTRITREEAERPLVLSDGTMVVTNQFGQRVFYR